MATVLAAPVMYQMVHRRDGGREPASPSYAPPASITHPGWASTIAVRFVPVAQREPVPPYPVQDRSPSRSGRRLHRPAVGFDHHPADVCRDTAWRRPAEATARRCAPCPLPPSARTTPRRVRPAAQRAAGIDTGAAPPSGIAACSAEQHRDRSRIVVDDPSPPPPHPGGWCTRVTAPTAPRQVRSTAIAPLARSGDLRPGPPAQGDYRAGAGQCVAGHRQPHPTSAVADREARDRVDHHVPQPSPGPVATRPSSSTPAAASTSRGTACGRRSAVGSPRPPPPIAPRWPAARTVSSARGSPRHSRCRRAREAASVPSAGSARAANATPDDCGELNAPPINAATDHGRRNSARRSPARRPRTGSVGCRPGAAVPTSATIAANISPVGRQPDQRDPGTPPPPTPGPTRRILAQPDDRRGHPRQTVTRPTDSGALQQPFGDVRIQIARVVATSLAGSPASGSVSRASRAASPHPRAHTSPASSRPSPRKPPSRTVR